MLKIGKLTDYAIVIMAQLARDEPGAQRSAAWLSSRTGLPEPTVSKVMKRLARQGLLESVRGASGGYLLPRPPATIGVTEIIAAMDGPIAIASCVDGGTANCRSEAQCPVRGNWDRVNGLIRDALSAVTLADMAAPAPPRLVQLSSGGAHVGGH
jgi:FeS assembly SUF system regulator